LPRGETKPATRVVDEEVFKQVYDSPQSLPGKHRWLTSDADVRVIERLLGMKPATIGAPLWVSGDTRECRKCGREDLRSFKCHNWAYARPELLRTLEQMKKARTTQRTG
jgi:hypothetical protein